MSQSNANGSRHFSSPFILTLLLLLMLIIPALAAAVAVLPWLKHEGKKKKRMTVLICGLLYRHVAV
jgi:hypothetical protein